MNLEERILAIACHARAEAPPRVDVTSGVLSILAAGRVPAATFSERAWMWMAALSSAVAVPVAVLAITVYMSPADPLTEIVRSISWVMQ